MRPNPSHAIPARYQRFARAAEAAANRTQYLPYTVGHKWRSRLSHLIFLRSRGVGCHCPPHRAAPQRDSIATAPYGSQIVELPSDDAADFSQVPWSGSFRGMARPFLWLLGYTGVSMFWPAFETDFRSRCQQTDVRETFGAWRCETGLLHAVGRSGVSTGRAPQ